MYVPVTMGIMGRGGREGVLDLTGSPEEVKKNVTRNLFGLCSENVQMICQIFVKQMLLPK